MIGISPNNIHIEGATSGSIFSNIFNSGGVSNSIRLRSTNASSDLFVKCNTITNSLQGINISRSNERTHIIRNTFTNTNYSDIYFQPGGAIFAATIALSQGSSAIEAGNEFTNPATVTAIANSSGNAFQFNYYIKSGGALNKTPLCVYNAPCNGFANYLYNLPASSEGNCNSPTGNLYEGDSESEYYTLLNTMSSMQRTSANSSQLQELEEKKGQMFAGLIKKSIKQKDLGIAKRILANESNLAYKKSMLGVSLMLKNWNEAHNFLNSLGSNTESLRNYKLIQKINIDRLKSNQKFKLNANEKRSLIEIAESDDADNSHYAKSLLSLLEGIRYDDLANANATFVDLRSQIPLQTLTVKGSIVVSPNPAQDHINVSIPQDVEIAKIVLYDIEGKVVLSISTESRQTHIDTKSLQNKLYFIRIFDKQQKAVHNSKIFINK